MESLFDRAWNMQDRVLLIGYDFKLGDAIDLKGLLRRTNGLILVDPNLIQIENTTNLTLAGKYIEDLRDMWRSQAECFEFKRSPNLEIYGEVLGKTKGAKLSSILYGLGSVTQVHRRNKPVNPLTKLKAIEGSKTVTPVETIPDTEFNFNAFLNSR